MNNEKKEHFWIPNEEVQRLKKDPTSRTTPRDVVFEEHGAKLSSGLELIKQSFEKNKNDDSLSNLDLYIFKVELPEGEKVQYKSELFNSNGMSVNVVKNERNAIVSTSKQQFQILKNRIDAYTQNGKGKTYFDYIDEFKPYYGIEKNSNELKKIVYNGKTPENIDIQLMFVPNLDNKVYQEAIQKVVDKIQKNDGEVQETPYYLSDNTPVIRAIIPSSMISKYENDSVIYRIEETHFFSNDKNEEIKNLPISFELDDSVDIHSLPIVVVLDSGVAFKEPLDRLVKEHWTPPVCLGGDCEHGTKVASRVAFKYVEKQIDSNRLIPRAQIIDCNILDGRVSENIMIKRIQQSINEYHDVSNIYNLSANTENPIEGDEMSIIGYELDAIQLKYNIQIVVSAGNHYLWKTESSISDILDEDESRISAPADSMLSVVVGAVIGEEHIGSLSSKNIIAPYSRRGTGFAGFSKPDISAYGGTIVINNDGSKVPEDKYSLVITKDGKIVPDAGTSFTAPIVSGDLAEIESSIPNNDILLAKALLYHNAKPVWEEEDIEDEELAFAHNLYGRGISSVHDSKYSSQSKVTFVRTGLLNKVTKERVTIFMPEILAAQVGRNIARVTVTCVSMPRVDRTKGSQYLGAYIRASLKKSNSTGRLLPVNQDYQEGRKKWDVCHHFSKVFSKFNSGDWQVWLELFSRWDDANADVPYALVVTIEDISNKLDIYSEIEALNRYETLNTVRVRIDS